VLDALKRGEKINAIKEYRLVTGVGLKEAKDFVEEIERRASPLI
jgi:ribosomal protein L7/L12